MNPHSPCEPAACGNVCSGAAACGPHDHSPLLLRDVRQRFEREAQQGECETGRGRYSFYDWGQGPPLVLLHGLADCHRAYLGLTALLSRHFRCLAYDLRSTTLDDLRHDLLALLDQLQLQQAYLFGSSLGATLALAALAENPERFPRAVLQAASPYKPLRGLEWPLAWLLSYAPLTLGRLPFRRRLMTTLYRKAFLEKPLERWLDYLDYTGRLSARTLGRQARLLHTADLRSALPRIRQPVLLVCGEDDSSDDRLGGLSAVGRVVIPGAGRLPMVSHPEEVADVVRQFLTPVGKQELPTCAAAQQGG